MRNVVQENDNFDDPVLVLPGPAAGLRGLAWRSLRPLASSFLRLRACNRAESQITRAVREQGAAPGAAYIDYFDLTINVSDADRQRIPETGPLLVTSNHPFGANDAMALLAIVESVRDDVKVFVNDMLAQLRFLEGKLVLVNIFGDAAGTNSDGMRQAARHVRNGGALIVLPAGAVSHLQLGRRIVTDDPWSAHIGTLARIAKATVLPAHVEGRNSWAFQLGGLIHPLIRTAFLTRELLRARGRTINVRFGDPVSPDRIARFESGEDSSQYLRALTYLLPDRTTEVDAPTFEEASMQRAQDKWRTVASVPTHSGEVMQEELDALGSDVRLLSQGDLDVYCVRAGDIPMLMLEVGRLREMAFRQVGEGSGRALDIDRYDGWYWQLLLWNRKKKELVGGYRLGLTDEIVPGHGLDGLYSHSLFEYDEELIEKISPAIELGRSFVREEYQRKATSLLMLWRAIGAFVVMNPQYRRFFGPVSISNEFTSMSRQLLISFLQTHRALPFLSELIKPRNPMKFRPADHWDERRVAQAITDPDDLDALVKTIESGRRSMPILLRQYLKLEAKLLAANVDADFGDVLDGLMYVDVYLIDRRVMKFFIGTDGMERFLGYYGEEVPNATSMRRSKRRSS